MIYTEEWGENPELLEHIKRTHPGGHRLYQDLDNPPIQQEFKKRAEETFTRLGVEFRDVIVFLSSQAPEEGDGYHRDYPHTHRAVLIYYLDVSDVPTPLHIFEGNKVIEELVPHNGLMAYVQDHVQHGVPKHKGTTNRIQIIAAAK